MTTLCPNGHTSTTDDYCDSCGAKIEAAAAPQPVPQVPEETCPNCGTPHAADAKFCEVCGYDFVTATLPAPPEPAPRPSTAALDLAPWIAVVTADRAHFDRTETDDMTFPDHCPERRFTLGDEEILIGRHSASRGVRPQIDLSGAPEDTGISHAHAVLQRQADGSYVVIDVGSTNGTTLNDSEEPLPHNVATPIEDRDRLYIGAWTKITFHAP